MLNEAKDQCRNSFKDKKIVHIIIDNYFIDNKNYKFMPQNINCDYFSIDINFICISSDFLKTIEKVVNKYQISINRIISFRYIKELFLDKNLDVVKMTKEILEGYNQNEVILTTKKVANKGFF